jgi:hypothetical protein
MLSSQKTANEQLNTSLEKATTENTTATSCTQKESKGKTVPALN